MSMIGVSHQTFLTFKKPQNSLTKDFLLLICYLQFRSWVINPQTIIQGIHSCRLFPCMSMIEKILRSV